MKNRPLVLGGVLLFLGYCWAMISRVEKVVSKDLEDFRRLEQMARLKKFCGGILSKGRERKSEVES